LTISLDESARLAGAHCWTERRLFEILGGWVASTPEHEVKMMLDRHAQHHAWRAHQWWDRLPVLADTDRDALVATPAPQVSAVLDLTRAAEGTHRRLAGAYRVALPRIYAAYRRNRDMAGPASDAAVLRTLGIVMADLGSDWAEGELLLQALLDSRAAVDQAAEVVAGLEGLLVAQLVGGESGQTD